MQSEKLDKEERSKREERETKVNKEKQDLPARFCLARMDNTIISSVVIEGSKNLKFIKWVKSHFGPKIKVIRTRFSQKNQKKKNTGKFGISLIDNSSAFFQDIARFLASILVYPVQRNLQCIPVFIFVYPDQINLQCIPVLTNWDTFFCNLLG